MIDLFSGAGGLSLGLEKAGFESTAAVEVYQDACFTYSSLFPKTDLQDKDIRGLGFRHMAGSVELVAGGPPCQPFSSGGKRLAQGDSRNMIPEFLRVIEEVQPPVLLMENVPGLVVGERGQYFREVVDKLRYGLGYDVTWEIVNAADYGVPQRRRRLILIGSRLGKFQFPPKTHGPGAKHPYEKSGKYLHKDKVIGAPNPSKVSYAKNPDLRPSPYDGHLFNGGGRAINLNDVCHTILASAGGNKTHFIDRFDEVPSYHAHLLQGGSPKVGILAGGRRLTVEESALIQTFPEGVRFHGSRSSQYTQVGNAVPPLLAEKIGLALRAMLDDVNGKTACL